MPTRTICPAYSIHTPTVSGILLLRQDRRSCVQVVSPEHHPGGISTKKCLYWAEGGGLITGTTVNPDPKLPKTIATTCGTFREQITGMYQILVTKTQFLCVRLDLQPEIFK
jgi:hypothetical protein